ncbi:MAG: hypothetical protein M1839_003704 [Geoglossum umbratile]|nr:MAG: hypothetical protein M1839_003704 [Geoglossum umbratile]
MGQVHVFLREHLLHRLEAMRSIYSIAFSPDDKLVVSGSFDKTVRLWDTSTGAQLQTFQGHSNQVYSVAFSPDGKLVASGSWDETIRLWDTSTGAQLQTLDPGTLAKTLSLSTLGKHPKTNRGVWHVSPLQPPTNSSEQVRPPLFVPNDWVIEEGERIFSGSLPTIERLAWLTGKEWSRWGTHRGACQFSNLRKG